VQLDSLVIEEQPLPQLPADATRAAMLAGIREMGVDVLPWTRDARDLQARMEFVRHALASAAPAGASIPDVGAHNVGRTSGDDRAPASAPSGGNEQRPGSRPSHATDWPDVSNDALAASLDTWLAPWLDGITRRDHLARLSLVDALRALLSWDQQKRLDELAPSHLEVPTGSRIRIDYLDESAPVVAVRLQEVFGLQDTPRIGGGRVPITFKLLSPAQRPVQVTRDLAGFWRGSYADVRKDMRGRYPKHYWPENPLEAEPTRGVRRRT
jgi:ATP-dependent helicase HrpB